MSLTGNELNSDVHNLIFNQLGQNLAEKYAASKTFPETSLGRPDNNNVLATTGGQSGQPDRAEEGNRWKQLFSAGRMIKEERDGTFFASFLWRRVQNRYTQLLI